MNGSTLYTLVSLVPGLSSLSVCGKESGYDTPATLLQMLRLCCRYLIYFSPFDVFYYLCAATPVRLMLLTIHEFARAKKVMSGVTMAAALYPNSLVAMAIVGMFKGSPVPILFFSFPFWLSHSYSGCLIPILL